jgi:hypothetical protein
VNSNTKLSQTLRTWRVQPPVDPSFRPRVWRRVEAAERRHQGLGTTRARAGSLLLAAAVTLLASGWTGHRLAEQKQRSERESLALRYVVDMDVRARAELGK